MFKHIQKGQFIEWEGEKSLLPLMIVCYYSIMKPLWLNVIAHGLVSHKTITHPPPLLDKYTTAFVIAVSEIMLSLSE